MDLPPTIPTSFVPSPSSAVARRSYTDSAGIFGIFAFTILGIVFLLALGVFFYERILLASQASKDAELKKATEHIDRPTIEGFVRLNNRLTVGETLLNGHIAFSNFFAFFGTILPSTVRFSSLRLSFDGKGKVKIDGSGSATSFNALAATSIAIAADGRLKDAIFSGIGVGKDSSVPFTLSATFDSKILSFSP